MDFTTNTNVRTGKVRSMGESSQMATELSFADMSKIAGSAAVGAALGEFVIRAGERIVAPSNIDLDKETVRFEVEGLGEVIANVQNLYHATKDYDEAQDNAQAKAAKDERKAEAKATKAERKAQKKAERKAAKEAAKNGSEPEA